MSRGQSRWTYCPEAQRWEPMRGHRTRCSACGSNVAQEPPRPYPGVELRGPPHVVYIFAELPRRTRGVILAQYGEVEHVR